MYKKLNVGRIVVSSMNMSLCGKGVLILFLSLITAGFVNAQLAVGFNITDPNCNGLPTGSATASPQGGTTPYTYLWSTGDTTQTIDNLKAETYSVTVTDANGLTASGSVTLVDPDVVEVDISADNCSVPYTITASGSGGAGGPFKYNWTTGESTSSISVSTPGMYCVTVTDANLCGRIACITVEGTPPSVRVDVDDVTCPGVDDGSVTAVPSGGASPFTYSWDTGETTQTISGLGAGTYSVTITDANGCTASASGTVDAPPDLLLLLGETSPSCSGDMDGEITAQVGGGTAPYTYLWNTGDTTQTIDSLMAGTYSVTVTDANGCTVDASTDLENISAIQISTDSEGESCPGENDGTATVTPSNGVEPYSYLWSNDETTQTITGLAPGVYRVTVTDDEGCERIGFEIVTAADSLEISVSKTDITTCGAVDGTASVTITKGTGPLTIEWSTGDTTAMIDSLVAGNYSVTVTDANECSTSGSVTIIEPDPVFVSLDATTSVCEGEADGIINANVTGGTMPFKYEWSNGDTTAMIDSLPGGTYIVTVTDANNCTAIDSATIMETTALVASLRTTEFVCGGRTIGEAEVTVDGGNAPYTYSWNTGDETSRIGGLGTGEYRVTITDLNGCTTEAVGRVTVIDSIMINSTVLDANCAGDSTGAIDLSIVGGMTPFTYAWSNGSTDSALVDIPAGFYSVTVTDAMSCSADAVFLVLEPDSLEVEVSSMDVLCGDTTTSQAIANVTGGTAPYQFEWSDGSTNDTLSSVAGGMYTVTVTDANECMTTATVTINDPGVPSCGIAVTQPVSNIDASDGEAEAVASGGVAPYKYEWSNGDTTAKATNLAADEYMLTVTDALGCTTTCMVDLRENVSNALLGDYAWFDRNRDGIQDPDEHGLEGIPVILVPVDTGGRDMPDTTFTDMNGFYFFEVPPGKYKLFTIQPDSLRITLANNESMGDSLDSDFSRDMAMTDTIMLMAGDKDLTWDLGFVNAPGVAISDPCNCLDNATNQHDGQFGEEVVVVEGIPGDTWFIIEQTGMFDQNSPDPPAMPIPIPLLTELHESDEEPGLFEIMFRHVEEDGYTISVSNGLDTLSISAVCFYPEIEITGLPEDSVTICINDAPIVPQIETSVPGIVTIFLNDSVVTEIDPATLGLGEHVLRVEIEPFDTTECLGVYVSDVFVINEFCPSTVGDYVWFDTDRDGIQDPDEQGVPDIKVILTPVDVVDARTEPDTAITDANGRYLFDVLEGDYKITFCVPDQYRLTTPNVMAGGDTLDSDADRIMMMTDTFFIPGGSEDLTYDAGLVDAPGANNLATCNCLDNATTADNGQFEEVLTVTGVAGDTWEVVSATNAYDTSSAAPPAVPVDLATGVTLTETSAGIYTLTFIHVDGETYTVEVSNGTDTLSASKTCSYPDIQIAGLNGDTLEACVNAEAFVPSISTTVPGALSYTINGMPVSQIDPAALGVGTYELVVTLTPNNDEECIAVAPVILKIGTDGCPAKLGDYVWLDEDEDGIQDSGEPGIEGVEVVLQQPQGDGFINVDVAFTDSDGRYCFEVMPGDYKVTFDPPSDRYEPTTPNAGDDAKDSDMDPNTLMSPVYTIAGAETNLTVDAGFIRECINVDDPGKIGYDQMICAPGNDPARIVNIRAASGGEGEIEYLWMKSESSPVFGAGGFKPIPGATGLSYDPGPIDVTTHFARCVRTNECPDYLEANIVTVEVKDDAKAEILADPITCYLSAATFEVVTKTSNAKVEWEFPGGMNPSSTDDKVVTATFNSFGYYTIKVTVTENDCSTSSSVRVLATYTSTYCDDLDFAVTGESKSETQEVRLEWEVLNDGLDYVFDIEHSSDGSSFSKVAEVTDPILIKGGYKQYLYEAEAPKQGRNLYRVQMRDNQGGSSLSNILELMLFEPGTRVMVYPNPVQDRLMVEFMEAQEESIQVELVTAEGAVLRRFDWDQNTVQNNLDLSAMPGGIYFIRIKIGSEATEVMKIFKKE